MTTRMTIPQLQERVDAACGKDIKFNLIHADGDSEGLWAKIVTAEDTALYEKDTVGDTITVILQNHALVGGPTWGMRYQIVTKGVQRPTIKIVDFLEQCNAQGEEYPLTE